MRFWGRLVFPGEVTESPFFSGMPVPYCRSVPCRPFCIPSALADSPRRHPHKSGDPSLTERSPWTYVLEAVWKPCEGGPGMYSRAVKRGIPVRRHKAGSDRRQAPRYPRTASYHPLRTTIHYDAVRVFHPPVPCSLCHPWAVEKTTGRSFLLFPSPSSTYHLPPTTKLL